MSMDKGVYHNFRLNTAIPEHIRINNFLKNLNKDYYKSKNQFIADALLYYIEAMENGRVYEEKNGNEIWDSIKDEALKELVPFVESKVMYMLGNFTSGMSSTKGTETVVRSVSKKSEKMQVEDDGFIPDEELAGVSNLFVD